MNSVRPVLLIGLLVLQTHAQSFACFGVDPPGAISTLVRVINNTGQVIGFSGLQGFLREADGVTYTVIAVPGATQTVPNGINNLGQIVGNFTDSAGTHTFVRNPDGSIHAFDVPGGQPYAVPYAINDGGEIVGGLSFSEGFKRSVDGSVYSIQFPNASVTIPFGIDNRGEIVGSYQVGTAGYGAFFRSADGSTYTTIDVPEANGASGINNQGQIVGHIGTHGFVRNADGTYVTLDCGSGTSPSAIDDRGRVAGTAGDPIPYGFVAVPSAGTRPLIDPFGGVITASAFAGADAVAPGTFIEIYGANLAASTREWGTSDFTGGVAPASLDGVGVSVNGKPAYVSYVSPGQVNAQVPSPIEPGPAQIIVTNGKQASDPYTVTVNALNPGLLAFPQSTMTAPRYIVALFPDSKTYVLPPGTGIAVPSRRARPGDIITFYGVGFGPVTPDVPAGRIATQANTLQAAIEVSFNGVQAIAPYAGSAPGFVGLYQLNVVVPNGVSGDAVPVKVSMNGTLSRPDGARQLIIAVEP